MNMNDKKSALINLSIIGFLYFLAIFANFLAPYSPTQVTNPTSTKAYSPPINFGFNIQEGIFFTSSTTQLDTETYNQILIPSDTHCHIRLLCKDSNNSIHLLGSPNCPQDFNILGTDKLGRDYLSRLLHGLQPSLYIAILGICISFPIGIIYGVVAGYYHRSIGELMMRLVEVILSLPSLYILVVLAGILPASLSNFQKLIMITIILSFIGWAGLARVVRGQVLSLSKKEFIELAQIVGIPPYKIWLREIIPQLSSYLIITITISFPSYVLGETALSFLGLGITQPNSSLGLLLAEGKDISNLFLRPWLVLIPGSILMLLAWNCNMLGDSLRNIFDPKQS